MSSAASRASPAISIPGEVDRRLVSLISTGIGDTSARMVSADQPDLVIVDIRMPPTQTDEGLSAAREIHSRWPSVGVLVLSTYVDTDFATQLITDEQRGVGYLLKDRVQDADELLDALRRLDRGGSVVDPEVVTRLMGRRRAESPMEQLSERERYPGVDGPGPIESSDL
jgi:DNA-binding NarL/FixJ family response regulator